MRCRVVHRASWAVGASRPRWFGYAPQSSLEPLRVGVRGFAYALRLRFVCSCGALCVACVSVSCHAAHRMFHALAPLHFWQPCMLEFVWSRADKSSLQTGTFGGCRAASQLARLELCYSVLVNSLQCGPTSDQNRFVFLGRNFLL